ncbi:MAG: 4Fe-4S dicluster domain-containing protein [Ktedonobacteraceae bacterium]
MTYVITQPCIGVKDGSCVDVCPVDCIHPAAGEADYDQYEQLYSRVLDVDTSPLLPDRVV